MSPIRSMPLVRHVVSARRKKALKRLDDQHAIEMAIIKKRALRLFRGWWDGTGDEAVISHITRWDYNRRRLTWDEAYKAKVGVSMQKFYVIAQRYAPYLHSRAEREAYALSYLDIMGVTAPEPDFSPFANEEEAQLCSDALTAIKIDMIGFEQSFEPVTA